ncbi:hypothetical protein Agabi119p4_10465 [Agaricus bisporus var. burnettii]|uniref:Uncharacterized protein n=1 Tax=Agaricus bisporus var. burnettii TaxID=192524 RepID=A0A8H7C2A2_AGABI|nr:hypothetical protein Agabi119p4_10465 [Agaricus bisporus var. burnettii]
MASPMMSKTCFENSRANDRDARLVSRVHAPAKCGLTMFDAYLPHIFQNLSNQELADGLKPLFCAGWCTNRSQSSLSLSLVKKCLMSFRREESVSCCSLLSWMLFLSSKSTPSRATFALQCILSLRMSHCIPARRICASCKRICPAASKPRPLTLGSGFNIPSRPRQHLIPERILPSAVRPRISSGFEMVFWLRGQATLPLAFSGSFHQGCDPNGIAS